MKRFGQLLEFPVGAAAGPQTQLAQNIITTWPAGARYIELKTIQVLDQLEEAKPCIDMTDEDYNCEWSQELRLKESCAEYWKAFYRCRQPEACGKPCQRSTGPPAVSSNTFRNGWRPLYQAPIRVISNCWKKLWPASSYSARFSLLSFGNPQNLCLDAGYVGSKNAVEQHSYIPHIRPRGEEKMALEGTPDFKAHRWVVEVCHSWLDRFGKLWVRFEKKADNYFALVQFARALIAWPKIIPVHQS